MGFGGMTSAVFVAGAVLGGADAFYASAPSDPAADLIARLGIHPASLEVLDQFGDDSFQVRVRCGAPWTAEQLADWYPPGDVMLTIVAGVLNVSDGGVQVRAEYEPRRTGPVGSGECRRPRVTGTTGGVQSEPG